MSTKPKANPPADFTFADACRLVEAVLMSRADILDVATGAPTFAQAMLVIRDSMRQHLWRAGRRQISLDKVVRAYDRLTREDGFHVLHDWDGVAGRVLDDQIAVDVLHYVAEQRVPGEMDRLVLAMLVDYYLMNVLALLSLRIWDDGDPDENLDRLNTLLALLQGPEGSGHRFSADAETLILIATAHYERDDAAYDRLLVKTRLLNAEHSLNIALGHAAAMGCHLRFGFEATYGRDTVNMRDDNVADYPWLCFAVMWLMREYDRLREAGITGPARDRVVEALLNGLSSDARAFLGTAPASLAAYEADRLEFRDRFLAAKDELLAEFERFRPTAEAYTPLAFFFNFSHNVVKGGIIDALLWSEPWDVTLNDLFTSLDIGGADNESKQGLATTLMGYARANPHKIRGKLMPVIVYDPATGHRAYSLTLKRLQE
ncbi:MAG: hypothetical protein AB7V01_16020 [Vicinamibacterales bacterium]